MASKRVTAVVDVKTWKKLKEFAKQRGMLRSEVVLRAIRSYVEKEAA